ncbi:serine/threonine-protein kinase haspin homolog [Cylas formicarius]|uniref:serine/threonine-protein kinase haspin homolog n=1 Tax=Cylas formicarius TaxID=197179 RepID=UPI002958D4F0|nr:serine/threonine-protein kinase haspin homolog [Cylas formicarius]
MLLCEENSPRFKDDFMCKITYDYASGYEESSRFYGAKLEESYRNLPLISATETRDEFIYDESPLYVGPREIVLQKCHQSKPLPFEECYPKSLLQNCHKIGEGIYGEVFLYKNKDGGTTVMKVIPIEGIQMVNGDCQRKFEDLLSEIIIAKKLSNLRFTRENQTDGFVQLQKVRCVQGRYPEELLELWELFDETRGSENDSPIMFQDDQLYIVFESSYGGTDLESFLFDDASQAFSVITQVALTLAVAEEELQFEHRDLHWGNVLVSRVPKDKTIKYKLDGQDIMIKSYGVQASIIDFNMSRVECSGAIIFNDIGRDLGYFNTTGDYQFEIYRLMQEKNGNEWRHFEPYSNILWLSYILDKVITSLHYKHGGKKHKQYISKMTELNLDILGYKSAHDLVVKIFRDNDI